LILEAFTLFKVEEKKTERLNWEGMNPLHPYFDFFIAMGWDSRFLAIV
jgi:hypothetical protein